MQWHNLSREEQAKYYDMAKEAREMHQQMYPGWTARDNYAINSKKKKKKRDKSQDGGTIIRHMVTSSKNIFDCYVCSFILIISTSFVQSTPSNLQP